MLGSVAMRCLVPALLALTAVGCVSLRAEPAEDVDLQVLDERGAPVSEAWVATWRTSRACPLGLLFWPPMLDAGPMMWPELRAVTDVRLWRVTPGNRRYVRPASYRAWINWGLLVLPPGSYCEAWAHAEVFAAGCPWGFDGEDWRSPGGRVLARARSRPEHGRVSDRADHVRAAWIAHVLDDPDVPREDLRDFAAMLLRNLEMLGVEETGPPDLARQLRALTK